nr:Gag-Pol polyprotein [Tanacetum cinerariifolium]
MESIHVNFDELPPMTSDHISSDPAPEYRTVTTSNELDLLFSLMFDELLNGSSKVVSKSSVVWSADAPNQRQQHSTPLNNHTTPASTCYVLTLAPTVTSSENINQAKTIGTPMATKHLDADLSGTPVDQMKYHTQPTEKHFTAVKQIFRYLKDTIVMGLWYSKDTGFELTAFSDSNHAGCLDSRKSTSGGIQFLGGDKLANWSSKKQDCTLMSSAEAERLGMRCLTPAELEALANEPV